MKMPKTDSGKFSLPGKLKVIRENGVATAYPAESLPETAENELKVVYDCGPVENVWDYSFEETRQRVSRQWAEAPSKADAISPQLKEKIARILNNR